MKRVFKIDVLLCPHCGARLLLVGKTHPRTGTLEIHPLALEVASSGDTMLLDA